MQEAKTKTVAEVITAAIAASGKSKLQISRESGISYSVLWCAASGENVPEKDNAKKIASALHLPKTFLRLCEKEREQKLSRKNVYHGKWERELRQKYTVYDRRTDLPIIVDGTAEECAAAMGIAVDSFYSARSRFLKPRKQKDERWEIYKEEEL